MIFQAGIGKGAADPSPPSGSTHVLYRMLKPLNEIDGMLYFYSDSYLMYVSIIYSRVHMQRDPPLSFSLLYKWPSTGDLGT